MTSMNISATALLHANGRWLGAATTDELLNPCTSGPDDCSVSGQMQLRRKQDNARDYCGSYIRPALYDPDGKQIHDSFCSLKSIRRTLTRCDTFLYCQSQSSFAALCPWPSTFWHLDDLASCVFVEKQCTACYSWVKSTDDTKTETDRRTERRAQYNLLRGVSHPTTKRLLFIAF